ncbi:hypothetical protein UCRNP2_8267 [Neofusicoccum parvum UCRNP2]|uniref:Uncharacterized protein n=1 Tax=Botryosphaeria parva (strain UCR-NP2) TaxID=1287680 RepID=R1G0V9_BOTPV|nr:hypothetical protein UCRNP2_8267 [Neofusicoccum parvum UCRNP2]
MAADVQSQSGKAEKPAHKLGRAQVPVPDISIHSQHSEMRDLKSRYFTPMDSPTSPSSKSEKTVAPGTPAIVTTRKTEETPEKDDSFVTVQEEPSSAKKGFEKHESLVAAAREAMATPAPAGKSNWADGSATPEEFSTPLENKSEMDKVAEKTDKVKVEDSAVTDPLEKSMPHDTGSIHPMARPKGDKKKQPKKVKSYGKGKKGASGKS